MATEREMLDRLNVRYGKVYRNGPYRGRQYTRAEHVPETTGGSGWGKRIADFIAVDMFADSQAKVWQDRTSTVHGHEVKVSRSDWLAELRAPEKAGAWARYCHYWWLVVSDLAIVRDDLPEGWGLMVSYGRSLRAVVKPVRRAAEPMPVGMVAALTRGVMQTETRAALAGAELDSARELVSA